jgi:hypothetical protein
MSFRLVNELTYDKPYGNDTNSFSVETFADVDDDSGAAPEQTTSEPEADEEQPTLEPEAVEEQITLEPEDDEEQITLEPEDDEEQTTLEPEPEADDLMKKVTNFVTANKMYVGIAVGAIVLIMIVMNMSGGKSSTAAPSFGLSEFSEL